MQFNQPQRLPLGSQLYCANPNQPNVQTYSNYQNFFNEGAHGGASEPPPPAEGDIVPVQCADGTLQFFFVPRVAYQPPPPPLPPPPPPPPQPRHCSYACPYIVPVNAWAIRSVLNPVTPTAALDPAYYDFELPQKRFDNKPSYPFWQQSLTFHNDGETSTTDLRYFTPAPPPPRRAAAAVQATAPPPRAAAVQAAPAVVDRPASARGCREPAAAAAPAPAPRRSRRPRAAASVHGACAVPAATDERDCGSSSCSLACECCSD